MVVKFYAKFHPHRCNVSPQRGEKRQNRPLSKLNTGRLALRAMLPVTSGQSNLATGCIAAAHGPFNGIRQVKPVCTPHAFLDPPESKSQTESRSVQPLKIASFYEGSVPISNTWFLWSTPVLNSNGILIGSAVFSELTSVTDRPTDR